MTKYEYHYRPDTENLCVYEKNEFSPIINETVKRENLSDYMPKNTAKKLLATKLISYSQGTDNGTIIAEHHVLINDETNGKVKKMNPEESFDVGYQAGLDALDVCDKSKAKEKDALAGLMSVVMHSAYAMAPTEEMAQELITWAQQTALQNWEKEKKGGK